MIQILDRQRKTCIYKLLSCLLIVVFSASMIVPPSVYAQGLMPLPTPGMMVPLSPGFSPLVIRGLKLYPEEPLKFDFILDTGETQYKNKALEEESTKLIKYFLASLTVPEEDLWVNLSPYEKDKIIPNQFGVTEMGRDMLAQDYLLKQLTASLIHPEDELGKKFWERVYSQAQKKFGATDINVNTFNKVWVMPQKAVVYESGDTAFVINSQLKVMLEQDYLALSKNADLNQGNEMKEETLSAQIIREIIIPEIEREVNQGENFAQLRQIYHSMILATWFKRNLKHNILSKIYVGKNKVKGVDVEDKDIKEKIYQQYLEAFQKGVYNFIREDVNPQTQEVIPRKYFSGGMKFGANINRAMLVEDITDNTLGFTQLARSFDGSILRASAGLANPQLAQAYAESLINQAMLTDEDIPLPVRERSDVSVLISNANPFWSSKDAPVEAYMEIDNAVLEQGLKERVVRKILDAASHEDTKDAVLSGRSFIIPLGNDSFTFAGKKYTAIRIKAVTYEGNPPVMERYVAPKGATSQPTHTLYIDADGFVRLKEDSPTPTGTGLLPKSIWEYTIMKRVSDKGVSTSQPIGVGELTSLKMPIGDELRRVGFSVYALESEDVTRVNDVALALEEAWASGNIRNIVVPRLDLQKSLEVAVQTLRDFHRAGFIHTQPHIGQFGKAFDNTSRIYDLSGTKLLEDMSQDEYVYWIFNDFIAFHRGVYLSTKGVFNPAENAIMVRMIEGVRTHEQIIAEYFRESDEVLDEAEIEAAVTEGNLLELFEGFVDYNALVEIPVSVAVNLLRTSSPLGELINDTAVQRYQQLMQEEEIASKAMLTGDSGKVLRSIISADVHKALELMRKSPESWTNGDFGALREALLEELDTTNRFNRPYLEEIVDYFFSSVMNDERFSEDVRKRAQDGRIYINEKIYRNPVALDARLAKYKDSAKHRVKAPNLQAAFGLLFEFAFSAHDENELQNFLDTKIKMNYALIGRPLADLVNDDGIRQELEEHGDKAIVDSINNILDVYRESENFAKLYKAIMILISSSGEVGEAKDDGELSTAYKVARVIAVQSKKGTRPLKSREYLAMILKYNEKHLGAKSIDYMMEQVSEISLALQRTPEEAISSDPAMLSELKTQFLDVTKLYGIQEQVDFTSVVEMARSINPSIQIPLSDDEISRLTFAKFYLLQLALLYDVFIPHGFKLFIMGTSNDAPVEVFYEEASIHSWQPFPYLGSLIWFAEVDVNAEHNIGPASANDWYVYMDSEKLKAIGREEYDRYVPADENGLVAVRHAAEAMLPTLILNSGMDREAYAEYFVKSVRHSLARDAKDMAFYALRQDGTFDRFQDRDELERAKTILKENSTLYETLGQSPYLQAMGQEDGDSVLDVRALAINILAKDLGALIDEMREHHEAGRSYETLISFFRFITEQISSANGIFPEGQMSTVQAAQIRASKYILQEVQNLSPSIPIPQYLLTLGTAEQIPQEILNIVEGLYSAQFYTDEERGALVTPGVQLSGPNGNQAMLSNKWQTPEVHDADNFIMTAKFGGIDRLLSIPGWPEHTLYYSASVLSNEYHRNFRRNEGIDIGLRLSFPDNYVMAVLRQIASEIMVWNKDQRGAEQYIKQHRVRYPDNILLDRFKDLRIPVDIVPQDVVREIQTNPVKRLGPVNEVIVVNGEQLRPNGVLLMVRGEEDFQFIKVLKELKNQDRYKRVLPYARKHGLPFIIIPEPGADVEAAKETIKREFPEWQEVDGQPNVYWDSSGAELATPEEIRNRAMLAHSEYVAKHETRNKEIVDRFNARQGVVKVVDLGTGPGEFLERYKAQNPTHEIIGFDKSSVYDTEVAFDRKVPGNAAFLIEDTMETGVADKSVDKVIMNFPEEPITSDYIYNDIFGEVIRILKDGGELVIVSQGKSESNPNEKSDLIKTLEAILSRTFASPVVFRLLSEVDPDYPQTYWMKEEEAKGIFVAKITKTEDASINNAMLAKLPPIIQEAFERLERLINENSEGLDVQRSIALYELGQLAEGFKVSSREVFEAKIGAFKEAVFELPEFQIPAEVQGQYFIILEGIRAIFNAREMFIPRNQPDDYYFPIDDPNGFSVTQTLTENGIQVRVGPKDSYERATLNIPFDGRKTEAGFALLSQNPDNKFFEKLDIAAVIASHFRGKTGFDGDYYQTAFGKSMSHRYFWAVVEHFGLIGEEAESPNPAMFAAPESDTPGGIDFNPANLEIETRGSGIEIEIPLDGSNLENINIEGFVPIIFSITPITNLPLFLGRKEEELEPVEQLTSL